MSHSKDDTKNILPINTNEYHSEHTIYLIHSCKTMHRLIFCFLTFIGALMLKTAVAKPTCGPVCLIYCEFGNVLDEKGCPTCECIQPCGADRTPYPNLSCGRTVNSQSCPSNYTCITAIDDSYAVCCPEKRIIKKPSCPTENHFGVCINPECQVDEDCAAGQMCCGNCHRRCVDVYIKQDSSESAENF